MTIFAAVQSAIIDTLENNNALISRVNFIGVRSQRSPSPPYVLIEPPRVSDWSVKDRTGHEVRVSLSLAAPGDTGEPLHELMDAVSGAMAALPAHAGDWQIVTTFPLGSRTLAPPVGAARPPGPLWRAAMDYRLRLIRQPE